jgi:hypothetical protein
VDVEVAVEAHALEETARAGDIAGEAELDSEASRASVRVEQYREAAVVDHADVADIDDELLRPGGERPMHGSGELRRVDSVEVAANEQHGALPNGVVVDRERGCAPSRRTCVAIGFQNTSGRQ